MSGTFTTAENELLAPHFSTFVIIPHLSAWIMYTNYDYSLFCRGSADLKTLVLPLNECLFTWQSLQMLTKLCWCYVTSVNQMCTSSNHNFPSLIGAFNTNAFHEHAHAGLQTFFFFLWCATMHFCTQAQHHHHQRYVNKTITSRLGAIFGPSCLFSSIRHASPGCKGAIV